MNDKKRLGYKCMKNHFDLSKLKSVFLIRLIRVRSAFYSLIFSIKEYHIIYLLLL